MSNTTVHNHNNYTVLSVFLASSEPEVLAHYSVGHSDDELDAAWLVEECLLQLPFVCPSPSQIHCCSSPTFLFSLALVSNVLATPQVGVISPWYPLEQLGCMWAGFSSPRWTKPTLMYETDHQKICADQDACRKYSSTHPSLTPGIFTLLCRHGICCGFRVMESYESPWHPFEILLCRFPTPLKMIIYNNGCKLPQYVLNREPVHFKNTVFLVDRFHWRGHVICSSSYSLDGYTSLDVASINSQVNEQANAVLQRIKGHIANMKLDNFVSC